MHIYVQPNMMIHTPMAILLKNNPALIQLKFCLSAEFCACPMDNSSTLPSVSLNFEPSTAINIFHWSLVRSQPFAGASRFLAGLFTFLSRHTSMQILSGVSFWYVTKNHVSSLSTQAERPADMSTYRHTHVKCDCVRTREQVCAITCVCMCLFVCICVCACVCVHACVHACIYILYRYIHV